MFSFCGGGVWVLLVLAGPFFVWLLLFCCVGSGWGFFGLLLVVLCFVFFSCLLFLFHFNNESPVLVDLCECLMQRSYTCLGIVNCIVNIHDTCIWDDPHP